MRLFPLPQPAIDRLKKHLAPDFDRRTSVLKERYEEAGGDPFGFDCDFSENALLVTGLFYRDYFRVEMNGLENIPSGGALLVSNHSGQLPIDGVMIATGLLLDAPEPRLIRSMFDRWASRLPWVSVFFQRVGQVVGRPENVNLLLEKDELILVFPEGVKGIQKTFQKAYQLDEFGLGFMRLALAHGCPVVPVAVVGAEEQYPAVWDAKPVARLFGIKSALMPLQMLLPFIGLMPLPAKYSITIGKPMRFDGDADDEDQVIGEKVWVVRHTIQLMLERALREREHVFW